MRLHMIRTTKGAGESGLNGLFILFNLYSNKQEYSNRNQSATLEECSIKALPFPCSGTSGNSFPQSLFRQ